MPWAGFATSEALNGREIMPTDRLVPGLKAEIVTTVDDRLVVKHMGGGGVLSTPSMIGLMERAAIEAVQAHLPEGHTTVGFEIHVKHFGATPKGKNVRCALNCSKSMVASSASKSRHTTRTARLAKARIAARSYRSSPWADPRPSGHSGSRPTEEIDHVAVAFWRDKKTLPTIYGRRPV